MFEFDRAPSASERRVHSRGSSDLAEAHLTFSQKVSLVKAFVEYKFPREFWDFGKILNQLRNDFAHELEPKKLPNHIEALRQIASGHLKKNYRAYQANMLQVFETPGGAIKMMAARWTGLLEIIHCEIHTGEKTGRHPG